jgi:hypothetical protein
MMRLPSGLSRNTPPASSCADEPGGYQPQSHSRATRRARENAIRLASLLSLPGLIWPSGGLTDGQERRASSKYHFGAAINREWIDTGEMSEAEARERAGLVLAVIARARQVEAMAKHLQKTTRATGAAVKC